MYEQMKKNDVESTNQLLKNEFVKIYNAAGTGIRVLFAGNSITRHGVKEEIGWLHDWGMAASACEKDYVHLLMQRISQKDKDAAYCICQVSSWEKNYQNGSEQYDLYKEARAFQADIIIARFVENCPGDGFDAVGFKREYTRFIDYINGANTSDIVFTSGFWKHPGDEMIAELAEEKGCPFVYLGDLGEQDEMKALGLFRHAGVANHPGDKGMQAIADRIWEAVLDENGSLHSNS